MQWSNFGEESNYQLGIIYVGSQYGALLFFDPSKIIQSAEQLESSPTQSFQMLGLIGICDQIFNKAISTV